MPAAALLCVDMIPRSQNKNNNITKPPVRCGAAPPPPLSLHGRTGKGRYVTADPDPACTVETFSVGMALVVQDVEDMMSAHTLRENYDLKATIFLTVLQLPGGGPHQSFQSPNGPS